MATKKRPWTDWSKRDKIIFVFFMFWLLIIIIPILVTDTHPLEEKLAVVIPVLGGLTGAFFITGILVFIYYHKSNIYRSIQLIGVLAIIAVFFVIGIALTTPEDVSSGFLSEYGVIGSLSFLYVFSFMVLELFILVVFGMIWLVTFIQRYSTVDTLVDITKISAVMTDPKEMKKVGFLDRVRYVMARMGFNIPDILDTSTLEITSPGPRKKFPWPEFITAYKWSLVAGFVVMLLIAFNPFLLEFSGFLDLVGLSALVSFFVPLIILTWFVYRRLDVRIKGQAKDFKLYEGIKRRTLQSIMAISTLIIFIRIAVESMTMDDIYGLIIDFAMLSADYAAVAFITVFIFFNYFEDELARDVAESFQKVRMTGKKAPRKKDKK
jgi:hypothetical protein